MERLRNNFRTVEQIEKLENSIKAERDVIAPKVVLKNYVTAHSWGKAAEALSELVRQVREVRQQRQTRSTLAFDNCLDKYQFKENELTVLTTTTSAGNDDSIVDELVLDLYKFSDTITWARTTYNQDSETETVRSTVGAFLYYLIRIVSIDERRARVAKRKDEREAASAAETARRQQQRKQNREVTVPGGQPSSKATPVSKSTADRSDALSPYIEEHERDEAIRQLKRVKQLVRATADQLAPKLVIFHPSRLTVPASHSLAQLLSECVAASEPHQLDNSDRARRECIAAIRAILPTVAHINSEEPRIELVSEKAADLDLFDELVLDLNKLHKYLTGVQGQAPQDKDLQNREELLFVFLQSWRYLTRQESGLRSPQNTLQSELLAADTPAGEPPQLSRAGGVIRRTTTQVPKDKGLRLVHFAVPESDGSREVGEGAGAVGPTPSAPVLTVADDCNRNPTNFRYEEIPDNSTSAVTPANTLPQLSNMAEGSDRPDSNLSFHSSRWDNSPPRRTIRTNFGRVSPPHRQPQYRNNAPRKPHLSIPTFKNAIDVATFLLQFEKRMDFYQTDDNEKVLYLEDALKGSEAEPWIREYLHMHGPNPHWNTLVAELRREFTHPTERVEARARMEDRVMRSDESVRAYIIAKKDLIARFDSNLTLKGARHELVLIKLAHYCF